MGTIIQIVSASYLLQRSSIDNLDTMPVLESVVQSSPLPVIAVELERSPTDAGEETLPPMRTKRQNPSFVHGVADIVVADTPSCAKRPGMTDVNVGLASADDLSRDGLQIQIGAVPVEPAFSDNRKLADSTFNEPDSVAAIKASAWLRFWKAISHDPLYDPQLVDAYKDWKRRNRKERYDRRRSWVVAHGCKLGSILQVVNKQRSAEAWTVYQQKLAYMEE